MTESQEPLSVSHEIVARPDRRYRGKHLAFTVIMIAAGFWFAYDGWIGWPGHNQRLRSLDQQIDQAEQTGDRKRYQDLKAQLASMHRQYTPVDLLIQRILAVGLPVFGILYGAWTLAVTRGQYRLVGQALMLPGHDPIDFADIQRLDKSRWERKGIATLYYQTATGSERSARLDDFAYERAPTDEIFERIETYLVPPEVPSEPASE